MSSSKCKFAASHRPTPIVGPLGKQVRVRQKCRQEEQTWCFQVLWNWDLCPAVLQMQAASIFAASLPVALECQPRSEWPGLMALQIAKLGFLSQYIWGQAWELPAKLLTLMWQDTGPQLEGMTAALWEQVCSVVTLKWNIRYPSDETQRKQWLNCDLCIYTISSRAGDVALWVTIYLTCTRTWVPSPAPEKINKWNLCVHCLQDHKQGLFISLVHSSWPRLVLWELLRWRENKKGTRRSLGVVC